MSTLSRKFEASLASIPALAVRAYLTGKGWKEQTPHIEADHSVVARNWALWTSAFDEGRNMRELVLPVRSDLSDYSRRLNEALDDLEMLEERPKSLIANDIRNSRFDIIRVRIASPDTDDGSLGLEEAADAVTRAREMLLAGACSTIEPRMYYAPRKPQAAYDYVRKVRLGQTERGSFVFTLLSPVTPALHAAVSDMFVEDPFERRVTAKLAQGIGAMIEAAASAGETQELAPFENAVQSGLSANLCDAIAGLSKGTLRDRDIELSFAWALTRLAPRQSASFRIDVGSAELIEAAAAQLKAKAPLEEFEVMGPVVRTHREPAADIGKVVVRALVEGTWKNVGFDADSQKFNLATRALDAHQIVSVKGTLVKEGKSHKLNNPRDLAVVEDEESRTAEAQ